MQVETKEVEGKLVAKCNPFPGVIVIAYKPDSETVSGAFVFKPDESKPLYDFPYLWAYMIASGDKPIKFDMYGDPGHPTILSPDNLSYEVYTDVASVLVWICEEHNLLDYLETTEAST